MLVLFCLSRAHSVFSVYDTLALPCQTGYGPVLLAEVVATVENPPVTLSTSATSSVLLLLDNGAGNRPATQ